MEPPLQITFHDFAPSDAVEARLRSRVRSLSKCFGNIISCRVAVEARHHHHRTGNHYLVRVEVAVPGETFVANREPDEHHAYTDVYVAIRDAFDAVRRQLDHHVQKQRNESHTARWPA